MEPTLGAALRTVTSISDDPETRQRFAVDGMAPALVARPATEAEVGAVLRLAAERDAVVIPFGAGTRQELGRPPERVDVALSLERLNRVVEYEPADMTITVEAGTPLAVVQALTARHGQTLPLDPARAARATIGGLVATAASGPRRMAYGAMRDLLLGTTIVLADGRVIKTGGRVVKNVAGYDMNKLICGSLGTLGVITSATLKLRPLPACSQTDLYAYPDLAAALAAAESILASELLPAAVVALTPGAAQRLGADGPCALAVALEESCENVAYQAERLPELTHTPRTRTLTGEAEARFWLQVTDFGDQVGATYQLRSNTLVSELAALTRSQATAAAILYVSSGTVLTYGWETAPDTIAGIAEACQTAARKAGGTAVLERAPAAARHLVDPWGPPGPAFTLLQALKRTLDPGRVLNRGRYVGGI